MRLEGPANFRGNLTRARTRGVSLHLLDLGGDHLGQRALPALPDHARGRTGVAGERASWAACILPTRHCERSEATQGPHHVAPGLLRRFAPRNDGKRIAGPNRFRCCWASPKDQQEANRPGRPLWLRLRSPRRRSTVVSIVVGRLHEGMDLPDLVRRQSQAEGRHLRSFAALDHRFQEALVAELGGE